MKDYFKRNSPIFYIGIATAIVFLSIIIAGQGTPNQQPSLTPVEEKDLFTQKDQVIGFKDSRVTLVEFMDYTCPFCKTINPTFKNLIAGNKNKLRLIVRNFPLKDNPGHENSYSAALAAEASIKFNKFEDMHNALLESDKLDRDSILGIVERLGINKEEFIKEWENPELKTKVDQDLTDAANLQLKGTPSVFLNGKPVDLQNTDLNTVVLAEINRVYPQN
jgi:protein-disulfide isomerase